MGVLEKAKEWALENLVDEQTHAVLLVGSWARKEDDPRDIDLVVIKESQLVAMYNDEHTTESFALDIWVHDRDSMENELFEKPSSLTQIINASLTLSFIPDAVVWYEKEPFIEELKNRVKNWSWPPNTSKYLEFDVEEPEASWAKNAYNETIALLDSANKRIKEGKIVTHRRKDYPELIEDAGEDKTKKLKNFIISAYKSLGISMRWPEFDDAEKAINTNRYDIAFAMLKDVLRYIVRYELPSVPEEILDPSLWKAAEDMSLSEETMQALKIAYG